MARANLKPLLDQFGLPTPEEVAAALRSGYYTGGLLDFDPSEMIPRVGQCNQTPTALGHYAHYFRTGNPKEFTLLAHCYGTAMCHGWAWRGISQGEDPPTVPDGKGLLKLAAAFPLHATVLLAFSAEDMFFALETKRHGVLSNGKIDHDITFCGPLSTFMEKFKRRWNWKPHKLMGLGGMYITGFRHGWALHNMYTKQVQDG